MDYITVIGTDPQHGHDLVHYDTQPWAVAQVVLADDGSKLVLRVFSRHATHKGAVRSASHRNAKAAAATKPLTPNQRAFEAGRKAALEGNGKSANPHPIPAWGAHLRAPYTAWENGWDEGRETVRTRAA